MSCNNNSSNFDHLSITQQNKDHPIYFSLLLLDDDVVAVAVVVVVVGPWEKEVGVIQPRSNAEEPSKYEIMKTTRDLEYRLTPASPFIHSLIIPAS